MAPGQREARFEMVQLVEREKAIVLQSTDDDSCRNAYSIRKLLDCGRCNSAGALSLKLGVLARWNQDVPCETVSFALLLRFTAVALEKHVLLPVEQDVSSLVEESEPEVIRAHVAIAQL